MRSARVASKDATATGLVRRRQSCVYVCTVEHVLYVSVLQRGMYGEVCEFAFTLVVCIVVRWVVMSCSVMVSGLMLMFVC